MKRLGALLCFLFALILDQTVVEAQSSPGLTYGEVPNSDNWNGFFAAKQDVLNAAANSVLGNQTGLAGRPAFLAVPSCSGSYQALTWATNVGFGCASNNLTTTGNVWPMWQIFQSGIQARINNDVSTVAVGQSALQALTAVSSADTAIGSNALGENTTGINNTAVGGNCMEHNTTGIQNTCIGSTAMQFSTTGYYNTAVGYGAMTTNTTGFQNTSVGEGSFFGGDCSNNTYVGVDTGQGDSGAGCGGDNTGIGVNALGDGPITGTNNFAGGEGALNKLTSGTSNDAVGSGALGAITSGSYADAFGRGALANYTASYSIAMGYLACVHATTGNDLTCLGHNTGPTLTTGNNDILLGSNVDVPTASTSNYMTLADIIQTSGINTPSTSTTTANGAWTFSSISSLGQFYGANGSSTAPSYAFTNATDAGLYLASPSLHGVRLLGGTASSTSNGGLAVIVAGAGGSISGNGGSAGISGGYATSGNGGNANVTAGTGGGTGNGGAVNITAGNAPGSGAGGVITLQPGTSVSGTPGYVQINSYILATGYTVAQLPAASTHAGYEARVYDALTPTWGAVVAGGGAEVVKVISDGANWIVR